MKIAMITPYTSPILGGITSYTNGLSNGLRADGHKVNIISARGEPGPRTDITGDTKWLHITRGVRILRQLKPDIIHTHAHWYSLATGVLYKYIDPSTHVVHTFHTQGSKQRRNYSNWFLRRLLSRCDHITYVSNDLKSKSNMEIPQNVPISVSYSGVTAEEPAAERVERFRSKYHLNGLSPIIVYFVMQSLLVMQ